MTQGYRGWTSTEVDCCRSTGQSQQEAPVQDLKLEKAGQGDQEGKE